ncbi:hypothetical protein DM02DRAFT_655718 [Periconia macrospinosa]|uniref:F-box domain-containing protein n=1 Tax=Periconia macrospinosa TaxID=97972 RepID=A0A2V1DPJ1_9PLEO|nr:hypothetical protein DM02DRAFT_655718 [Periconia macrospinosa]
MPQTADQSSAFLRLPTEIRFMIYEYLGSVKTYHHRLSRPTDVKKPTTITLVIQTIEAAALLSTCRVVNREVSTKLKDELQEMHSTPARLMLNILTATTATGGNGDISRGWNIPWRGTLMVAPNVSTPDLSDEFAFLEKVTCGKVKFDQIPQAAQSALVRKWLAKVESRRVLDGNDQKLGPYLELRLFFNGILLMSEDLMKQIYSLMIRNNVRNKQHIQGQEFHHDIPPHNRTHVMVKVLREEQALENGETMEASFSIIPEAAWQKDWEEDCMKGVEL